MKIIFVCTGNTCRSPMAEGILKQMAPDFSVESRGIQTILGSETNPYTQYLLKEKLGIELNHKAIQLSEVDCINSDLIFTMTRAQADFIRNFTACTKVYPLNEYVEDLNEVADPFGQSLAVYEKTFDQLKDLIERALEKISLEFND